MERVIFIYELYVRMYQVDVLEMMDPFSPSNKMANGLLAECDDAMLMDIYRARVPWLAARAIGLVIQRQQDQFKKEGRE